MNGKESPEHYVWRSMISRCHDPRSKAYSQYGGRGITVCDQWRTYENFVADMGLRPEGMSIDRINNDEGYYPENCRWATRSEQQKNKSSTKLYTNGEFTGTLVECATLVGIGKELAFWRWKNWGTFVRGQTWQLL